MVNEQSCRTYCGKMNDAGDDDDEDADDDGSNGDIEGVPAQSPGTIIVTLIVTLSGLGRQEMEGKHVLFQTADLKQFSNLSM